MPSKESLIILKKNKSEHLIARGFPLKITNIFTRDWNITNSCRKEINQNMLWKKIILKINITYIEHKHKNTGNGVLIRPQNVEKQHL